MEDTSKNPENWTREAVETWLKEKNLAKLVHTFNGKHVLLFFWNDNRQLI